MPVVDDSVPQAGASCTSFSFVDGSVSRPLNGKTTISQFPVQIQTDEVAQKFLYGPTMFLRLLYWAKMLKWSDKPGRISFLQLLIDFKLCVGMDLPVRHEIRQSSRLEVHYKYHEHDVGAHIETRTLKQEPHFFLDAVNQFASLTRINLFPLFGVWY